MQASDPIIKMLITYEPALILYERGHRWAAALKEDEPELVLCKHGQGSAAAARGSELVDGGSGEIRRDKATLVSYERGQRG